MFTHPNMDLLARDGTDPSVVRSRAQAPLPLRLPELPSDWRSHQAPQSRSHLIGVGHELFTLRAVPMVGRDIEQDFLWSQLRHVHQDGSPRLVVLRGRAGVGKSALARWLVERSHELGASKPLLIHHDPNRGPSHGPIAAFRRDLGLGDLTYSGRVDAVSRYLRRRGADDAADARALGALLSHAGDVPAGDEVLDARERFALLQRLFALLRLPAPRPGLVRRHPMGRAEPRAGRTTPRKGRPALPHRPHRPRGGPRRGARRPPALGPARAPRPRPGRALGSLVHRAHGRALARPVPLGPPPGPPAAERVEGNPLFAVQLLGDWIQRGLLVSGADGYTLSPGVAPTLPDDLHDVWNARLGRLFVDAWEQGRPALELAAALGTAVHDREWRQAAKLGNITIPSGLVARLVRERLADADHRGWSFAHTMLERAWCAAPWSPVDGHRTTCTPRPCSQSEPTPRAAPVGADTSPTPDSTPKPSAPSSTRRGTTYTAKRPAPRRASSTKRASAWNRCPPRPSIADTEPGACSRPECRRTARTSTAPYSSRRPPNVPQRSMAGPSSQRRHWQSKVTSPAYGGILPSAWRFFHEALDKYELLKHDAGVADTLRSLSNVATHQGDASRAEAYLDRARLRYEAQGDQIGAALCLAGLGDIARMRRRFDDATEAFRGSLTVLRAEGHRSGVALGLHGLAEVHRLTGRLAEAEQGYQEVIRLDKALGRDASISALNLALCKLERREYLGAIETLDALEQAWSAQMRPGYLAIVHVTALPCHAALGRWEDWDRHMAEAQRLLHASAFVELDMARTAESAARLADGADQRRRARVAWKLAREQWQALGFDERVAQIDARLSEDGAGA